MTTMKGRLFFELLREATGNIRSMKARSIMALVGIAIGTAAVIAMLHVGHNARIAALRQFEMMGTDLINILPGSRPNGFADLTETDLSDLIAVQSALKKVAAIIRVGVNIRSLRSEIGAVGLAVSNDFFPIIDATIDRGRVFSSLDKDAPYVIIGSKIAEKLSADRGQQITVGDHVQIGRKILTLVGVLKSAHANLVLRIDPDNSVLVPLKSIRHLGGPAEFSAIAARLSTAAAVSEATHIIHRQLGSGVNIQTAQQLIAGVEEQMRIYSLLLLAIGSVSLVVGGVGIMNVMLMNVVERRQEIGLRQALGARQSDIRNMFLIEALIVSNIGSAIGVLIGFLAAWLFARASGWSFIPSPFALPMGVFMAVGVGLFFGSYPAIRASKMNPVSALRSI